jgi:hypothetical protein
VQRNGMQKSLRLAHFPASVVHCVLLHVAVTPAVLTSSVLLCVGRMWHVDGGGGGRAGPLLRAAP